jgi:hypothetical protein
MIAWVFWLFPLAMIVGLAVIGSVRAPKSPVERPDALPEQIAAVALPIVQAEPLAVAVRQAPTEPLDQAQMREAIARWWAERQLPGPTVFASQSWVRVVDEAGKPAEELSPLRDRLNSQTRSSPKADGKRLPASSMRTQTRAALGGKEPDRIPDR